jgi:hypothetical protein
MEQTWNGRSAPTYRRHVPSKIESRPLERRRCDSFPVSETKLYRTSSIGPMVTMTEFQLW